jgi:hypothetical protein
VSVLANTFSQIGHYMNFYANCDLVETTTELDRLVVSMPGVHAGDIVEEWGQSVAGTSALAYSVFRPGVTITARGPCPAEQWPTLEYSMGSCDKMPVLPAQPVPPVPRAPADRPESSRDISLFVILAIGGLVSLAAAVLLYLRHHKRDI